MHFFDPEWVLFVDGGKGGRERGREEGRAAGEKRHVAVSGIVVWRRVVEAGVAEIDGEDGAGRGAARRLRFFLFCR